MLFNIARCHAEPKVREILIRELLFADDAALASHTESGLQQLINQFSAACKEFGLTISLKKTKIMAQSTNHPPTITINGYMLETVDNFTYLGSSISRSHKKRKKTEVKRESATTVNVRL